MLLVMRRTLMSESRAYKLNGDIQAHRSAGIIGWRNHPVCNPSNTVAKSMDTRLTGMPSFSQSTKRTDPWPAFLEHPAGNDVGG